MKQYITRISSVEIPVSDLLQSVLWYTRILGVQVQFKDGRSAMLTFDSVGVPGLFLCETNDASRLHFVNTNTDITHSVIDFYAEDLEGFHRFLSEQGVRVGELNINPEFGVGGFGFQDPDGNVLGACNAVQRGQV